MGIADKDYFLDADGKLTTDEQTAATLLIRKGQDVPSDIATQYKIGKTEAKSEAKSETPTANKKAAPTTNK